MSDSIVAPLVSVLVPLYNHARFVNRCLDSVLEDGYSRVEIIIIDDGSKDDSAALAQQWFDRQDTPQIERFELGTRPNKGVTRTLNELIHKAQGDYLVFLASDDYLLPGGITARLEYLLSHPSKLAVFGDCVVVNDSGVQIHGSGIADLFGGRRERMLKDDLLALELIFNWCVPGPVFMADRRAFEMVGGYDEMLLVEDWDMYLRLAAREVLGFVNRPVAAYRIHGSNVSLNKKRTVALLQSMLETALKHAQSFTGITRLRLLHHVYQQKSAIARGEGDLVKRWYNRRVAKLLSWITDYLYSRMLKRRGMKS